MQFIQLSILLGAISISERRIIEDKSSHRDKRDLRETLREKEKERERRKAEDREAEKREAEKRERSRMERYID